MRYPIAIAAAVICTLLIGDPLRQAPAPIFDYIRSTWGVLTRSHHDLAAAAADPKLPRPPDGRWPVWLASDEDLPRVEHQLRAEMGPSFAKIELRRLPADLTRIREQGLLYLPYPYVVPGGRFNEMYGWDSFFIELGLLHEGRLALAQNMVDNFLYEIREYGKILNANRTYYLTRSQPPFLTEMILLLYRRTQDRRWLEAAVPEIEKYYRYWTTAPHLTPETGLSRYYDQGSGPAPEVLASERDPQGRSEYDLAALYFRTHRISDYDASQYFDFATGRLKPLFYVGDRSMRESGFDPSERFGPFSVDIIHYDPVCLNSLLYLMEQQTAEIFSILGRQNDAAQWTDRARDRASRINREFWDEARGMFLDYNFDRRARRDYQFLTTFYPMWSGMASSEQARRIARNLPLFERAGGLQTSTVVSGNQWDSPFGWAPLEWIAVEGLRRYGYAADADRIATDFLKLVLDQYKRDGTLVEKYDVVHLRTDISAQLRFGYRSNEAGFGWTNGVFEALFDEMPASTRKKLNP